MSQGRLTDPAQFANMVVNVGLDGRITQFKDIGRAELAAADYSTAMTFDGKPAVAIAVFELPGANAIQTANAIYARHEGAESALPAGRRLHDPVRHHALRARQHAGRGQDALREASALVALVVLIFLQNWRAALVPLLAIPVSLIGTFAVMYVGAFLDEHADALRAGAGDRHRGG